MTCVDESAPVRSRSLRACPCGPTSRIFVAPRSDLSLRTVEGVLLREFDREPQVFLIDALGCTDFHCLGCTDFLKIRRRGAGGRKRQTSNVWMKVYRPEEWDEEETKKNNTSEPYRGQSSFFLRGKM